MSKCFGCGIELQNDEKGSLGYTKNLENNLCERCFRLKNYGEYSSVSLDNSDYQRIIERIPSSSLVLYVSDLFNLNLTSIPKFSNILLVLTKRDLLPKSVKDEKIIQNIKERYSNFLDVICISSQKNYHMDRLYEMLHRYGNHTNIYLIGNTNSGKSTLINKLISNYGNSAQKPNITVSMYPSTTLDTVEIKLGNLTLIDTPGLIENGNYTNILSSGELKQVTPKKEIKPRTCQIVGRGSIVIGNYARIDYETEGTNSMVIYTSNMIDIRFASIKSEVLKNFPSHFFDLVSKKDIVIPGLGFIKFVSSIKVKIYTLDKVIPFERDNLI